MTTQQTTSFLAGAVAAILVALIGLGTYAHETAHRAAANLLFNVVDERIQLTSFVLGLSSDESFGAYRYATDGPTRVGRFVGEPMSQALVFVAGPLVDTGISGALYVGGVLYRRRSARASLMLRGAGVAYFGATAYHVWTLVFGGTGDLFRLARLLGVPPILIGVLFVLFLPALILVCLRSPQNRPGSEEP